MTSTSPRRFRFGLRSLFVLVVIAAIPCAWVGYSLNWIRQRNEIRTRLPLDIGFIGDPLPSIPPAPGAFWLFGETGMDDFALGPFMPDTELERVQRLFPEAKVRVAWANDESDAGFVPPVAIEIEMPRRPLSTQQSPAIQAPTH